MTSVWGLNEEDPGLRDLLRARELIDKDPFTAAGLAEGCFPGIARRPDLAPWLAFVVAARCRIHTLSRFQGLDPFITFFAQRRGALKAPASVVSQVDACFFGTLVFRRPDHPRLQYWSDRCLDAFERAGPPAERLTAANYLILHRIWCGDLTGADALCSRAAALVEGSDDVFSRLLYHSMCSMVLRLFLRYRQCEDEIRKGLDVAESSGIHAWDSHFHMQGAFLALSRGNLDDAGNWLERMAASAPPEHYLDRSGYHYARGWLHCLREEGPLAIGHTREAVSLAARSGAIFPLAVTHVGLGQLYLDQGRIGAGVFHLAQARHIGRRMKSDKPLAFFRGLLQAHVAFRMRLRKRGRAALRRALALGREQHYLNFPWWRSRMISRLCAHALEADIETPYVRTLIQRRRLRPPPGRSTPNAWHWPLTIQVLGSPDIRLDGEAVELGPRTRQLLLALACLGDGQNWVSRERLADLLWPDSDGDRARQTLDTSIHRLRRQLGTEPMVLTRPGVIQLDSGLCRVDYWELLRLLESERLTDSDIQTLLQAARQLGAAHLDETRKLLPARTLARRIGSRVVACAQDSGRPPHQAQEWLETLVELMPGSEHSWQSLIRQYRRQGLTADALDAWERCREALRVHHGVEPSEMTQALVGGLRREIG